MSEHVKNRLVDIVTMLIIILVLWAAYTGYVLMKAVNDVFSGQCSVIQEQALDKAVEAVLKQGEKE